MTATFASPAELITGRLAYLQGTVDRVDHETLKSLVIQLATALQTDYEVAEAKVSKVYNSIIDVKTSYEHNQVFRDLDSAQTQRATVLSAFLRVIYLRSNDS